MNYLDHYNRLIARGKLRRLPSTAYIERHHIVPRCLGGTDDICNIVALTPEEHYVAHQLLIKIYPTETKLIHAAHLMCYSKTGTRPKNKLFGWIKRLLAAEASKRFKVINCKPHDRTVCPYCGKEGGSHNMRRYHFENCIKHPNEEICKLNKIKRIGKPQSEETKAKRKETQRDNPPHKGKQHSASTKLAMSKIKLQDDNPLRGVKSGPQPIVVCPFCLKQGGKNNMTKYHFGNCMSKTPV